MKFEFLINVLRFWGYLMGFVANSASVYALLRAMEQVLPRFGVDVDPGEAIPAAEAVFRDRM